VSRLEKSYLAATKIVDTYFDQGENIAVPWHMYWIKSLRLQIVFALARFVLTDEIAETVWACLTASTEKKSKQFFIDGARAMLLRTDQLPDSRMRKIVVEALQWARENPEDFSTYRQD